MNQNIPHIYDRSETMQLVRHRVLRNTYWLLALSMIPTVLGAVVGVQMHLPFLNTPLGLLAFMAGAYGFIFAIMKTRNSGLGVAVLLAFTFFMGLMLTPLLSHTLGYANGGTLIMMAFGGTAAIMAVMASVATVSTRDFSGMGQWLSTGITILILASLANIFIELPALALALSVMAVVIFSAYLLYTVQRIVNGGETNYITATLMIYLSLYNIFSNLLALLGMGGSSRD